jgi:predicted MFS family arabinose efflux permease
MPKINRIRFVGMIAIIIVLLVYLSLRTASGADVPFLQLVTMLIGCAISLASMIAIYVLDKPNRKSTLISIILIICVVIFALVLR